VRWRGDVANSPIHETVHQPARLPIAQCMIYGKGAKQGTVAWGLYELELSEGARRCPVIPILVVREVHTSPNSLVGG
jgi:hypothetical protein